MGSTVEDTGKVGIHRKEWTVGGWVETDPRAPFRPRGSAYPELTGLVQNARGMFRQQLRGAELGGPDKAQGQSDRTKGVPASCCNWTMPTWPGSSGPREQLPQCPPAPSSPIASSQRSHLSFHTHTPTKSGYSPHHQPTAEPPPSYALRQRSKHFFSPLIRLMSAQSIGPNTEPQWVEKSLLR